jgi:hypothetical protein
MKPNLCIDIRIYYIFLEIYNFYLSNYILLIYLFDLFRSQTNCLI